MRTNRPTSRFDFSDRFRRAPAELSTTALALVLFICAVLGCESSNSAIDQILYAKTKKDFNEALIQHGSLRADEVQYCDCRAGP